MEEIARKKVQAEQSLAEDQRRSDERAIREHRATFDEHSGGDP